MRDPDVRPVMRFWRDECGAVTTDWVVLTGVAFLLAAIVVINVRSGAQVTGDALGNSLDSATLQPIGGL